MLRKTSVYGASPLKLPMPIVELVATNQDAATLIETAFVIDSLKILLRSNRSDQIASFCDAEENGRPPLLRPFFSKQR